MFDGNSTPPRSSLDRRVPTGVDVPAPFGTGLGMPTRSYRPSVGFRQAFEGVPREPRTGVAALSLPGVSSLVSAVLDSLAEIASDPTRLDGINDRLLRLARRASLDPAPKIDAHGFTSYKGFKWSIQGGVGTATHLKCDADTWSEPLLPVIQIFEQLEDLRRLLSMALAEAVPDPWWMEKKQSIRLIRYFPGLHAPQVGHVDPPVIAMVVLPPGDDRLMVRTDEGEWHRVEAGEHSKAVLLPGTAAAQVMPGARALEHAVERLNRSSPRDVATLFVG